mgnify:CR=1 FL=1
MLLQQILQVKVSGTWTLGGTPTQVHYHSLCERRGGQSDAHESHSMHYHLQLKAPYFSM